MATIVGRKQKLLMRLSDILIDVLKPINSVGIMSSPHLLHSMFVPVLSMLIHAETQVNVIKSNDS